MSNVNELSKAQIDEIEVIVEKYTDHYFGPVPKRYERVITDNGLLEVNVDDMLETIPQEAWDEILAVINGDIKQTLIDTKVAYGELTKKADSDRIYIDPLKQ